MKIVHQINQVKGMIREVRQKGGTIGFVPTMGYLHEGHLSLMRRAKVEQAVVVASIFVNPLQFGPKEDLAVYPRDLERDSVLAESADVDILFVPAVEEMYPQGVKRFLTVVDVAAITGVLCGAARPGHFRGVTTVVNKLFHIVEPDAAYFGQKDAQQVTVIKRMVEDLNMNISIVTVPTVREADGLALSSRNVFLNVAERRAALVLHQSLQAAVRLLAGGCRSAAAIRAAMTALIAAEPLASIDYIAVVDRDSLAEIAAISGPVLIALAVRIGKTRLIDNMVWEG
ncbi:pantoate--beta-alanine ligase|uniref:Pantothenate synthetase n=1 Tax=Dendrosporobacter quercicolus TaxID=146817 RepID=A0A1G9V0U9_9FIRM|nr:pantoate--beta-alanine ligase [Dendrosporobacter quercicolus]NSL47963.1 pantoate--beta-alanine ligase [Dendrosporobacter quercicolus DSM 1736]SDM65743.1 pantothenate synthetase [Dendrosporobacter quercicolus]